MAKQKAEDQQPIFPFLASITVKQDCSDYREEPNRIHYVFKSKFPKTDVFTQAVKDAVKDWIKDDPESFANAVTEYGMDDLAAKPGKKGYAAAAAEVEVTWKMVACGMPEAIAIRHGFITPNTDISIVTGEYNAI